MAARVFLHIGASKTGTTYIQGRLAANAESLAKQGLLFPKPIVDHFRFMLGVLQQEYTAPRPNEARNGYARILDQVATWDGTAVISNELLAAATPDQVRQLRDRLAPADVHVVYTVRDLARTLAAEWQQAVKDGYSERFGAYAQQLVETFDEPLDSTPRVVGPDQAIDKFRALHRFPDVFDRWSRHIPPEHVHAITLPRPGASPDILWERFTSVLGVGSGTTPKMPPRSNRSIGAAEAELLRSVNGVLQERGAHDFALREWVRHNFVLPILMRRSDPRPIALLREHHDWARQRAVELLDTMRTRPYDVVGSLEDLLPAGEPSEAGVYPDNLDEGSVAAVAAHCLADLLLAIREQGAQERRAPGKKGESG